MSCPDCKGSGWYVGIGFYQREPCQACSGLGSVPGPAAEAMKLGVASSVEEYEELMRAGKALSGELPRPGVIKINGSYTMDIDRDPTSPADEERVIIVNKHGAWWR